MAKRIALPPAVVAAWPARHLRLGSNLLVLRGGAWTLIGKVANAAALLATTAVLARALPAPDFASYLLAFSVVTVLGTLCCLGQEAVAMRLNAEARSVDSAVRVGAVDLRILLILPQ